MKKTIVLIVMFLAITSLSFAQWIQQGIGLDWANARWISIVDANTAYFGADYGGFGTKIYKTINGGVAWTMVYSNSAHENRGGGKIFSDQAGYAAFEDKVMKTSNGGQTWSQIFQTGSENPTIRSLAFPTENVGYAFYWQSSIPTWTVAKTTNGTTWNIVYQNASMEFNQYSSAMFMNETVGCIPGYGGHLYKTTNGGSSWTDMMLPEEVFRVFMMDANIIFAVSGTNTANVYKSTNGGSSWVMKTVPSSVSLMDIGFINQNTGWVCATDGKVYRTDNGGDIWSLQTTPASYLRYISFADINNGWSLGSSGMLIHTTNGGVTLLAPTVTSDPATNITETTASLNGTVNANNTPATVAFEYGTTTAYGNTVNATPGTVPGNSNTPVSANIMGLTRNTLYHYRCLAVNSAGTTNGNDMTFTTLCTLPGAAGPVTGPAGVCEGTTGQVYSIDPIPDATGYTWAVPTGAIISGGWNTNMITVNFPAGAVSEDVTVYGTNGCGNGSASSLAVMVNPVPPSPVITQSGNILFSNVPLGNQWYFNGNLIPGATQQVFQPMQSGHYSDIVTMNGCSSAPSNLINFTMVGIMEKEDGAVKIYPNPSSGLFTIEFRSTPAEEVTITVYNILGMNLAEIKSNPGVEGLRKSIDLRGVTEGVYFIRIRDAERELVKKVVIKR